MLINGKIKVNQSLKIDQLKSFFENLPHFSLSNNHFRFTLYKLPVFPEHKLFIRLIDNLIIYKVSIPGYWPLAALLFITIIMLAQFINWKIIFVGGLVVTGILFAIYVITDKAVRKFISDRIPETFLNIPEKAGTDTSKCPACGATLNQYSIKCVECGLHIKRNIKNPDSTNTSNEEDISINYTIKP